MSNFPAERRREIERLVNSEGAVSIASLSKAFNVSEMTIHRDLSVLESVVKCLKEERWSDRRIAEGLGLATPQPRDARHRQAGSRR